jgi:hypothetical protein
MMVDSKLKSLSPHNKLRVFQACELIIDAWRKQQYAAISLIHNLKQLLQAAAIAER